MPEDSKDRTFLSAYGPWALVTGAAEGLGLELAKGVAQRGLNVVLVDVQWKKAQAEARQIAEVYGVETRALECDLAQPDFLAGLTTALAPIEVSLLICNAGIGQTGAFLDLPLESAHAAVAINCLSTLTLCHQFLRPMVDRGRGGVLIIASNAGYAGTPYIATYAATKAFDLSLGEALWFETQGTGVDVMSFAPQGTNTPGYRRGSPHVQEGETHDQLMAPEEAARIALDRLGTIPSFRPDQPESFSRSREQAIKIAGRFAAPAEKRPPT